MSFELRELRFEIELERRLLRKQVARDFLHPIVDQSLGDPIPFASAHKLNAELRDDIESDDSMVLKAELERLKQLTSKLVVRNSGEVNPLRVPTVAFIDDDECSECPSGAPLIWVVTYSGFTEGSCSDCSPLNATHELVHQGGCLWTKQVGPLCGGPIFTTINLRPSTAFPDFWIIQHVGIVLIGNYLIAKNDFDCLGDNIFFQLFEGSSCTGGAGNVTVSPKH